ncbi:hypothetical protein [Streptomyces sp. NPDC088760]|uniref:hypothetical protein n=1 Tax=Streptomyces sp. NPDC088760 TaxID=3365890 RepID=UPI0038049235
MTKNMAPTFDTEVVDKTGTAAGQVSLAVDETNTPWIAYATNGGNVVVAHREEDGWSRTELPAGPAARDIYRIGLAIDSRERPHVAFPTEADDHLVYGVRDTQWTFEDVPTSGGILTGRVRFVSLRLHPGVFSPPAFKDTPNLAYQSGFSLWYATKAPPKSTPDSPPRWKKNVQRVDEGDVVEKGWFPVLDFDAQETLRIAYFDDLSATGQAIRRLRVATRVPGTDFPGQPDSWQVQLMSGDQILGEYPAMGHSITGESFISYHERTERALKLCIFGNFPESPATETVSNQVAGDDVHSACAVNHNSRICVVYGSEGRLKFATRTGIATFDLQDVEAGGAWSDLVFDREGSAHVAHLNGSELRYGLAP